MATQKRGKCCAGELCKHLQFCKRHKCSGCNGIVHLVCASEDAKTDKRWCFKCASKPAAKPPPPRKSANKKACKACGETDHKRKSSHLCKYNSAKRTPSPASVTSNKRGNIEKEKVMVRK
eukprot:8321164-Ditylum_brightwellii.AAC.1